MNTKTEYGIKMSGIPLDGETLQIIPFSMIKELQTIICYDYEDGKPWHDLTCVMELVFNNDDFDDVTGKDIENNGQSIRYLYTHPWDLLRDFSKLNEFEEDRVHCWLKLYMLSIATSYRIREAERVFKSEYIVSQAIMMACRKMGYDGVAYYSKRVDDVAFAFCAINLALFVDYAHKKTSILHHIKMDDSFNYAVFKHLDSSLKYKDYELRSVNTGLITNIGSFARQYPYKETDFYEFDKFLFVTWSDRNDSRKKEQLDWEEFVK